MTYRITRGNKVAIAVLSLYESALATNILLAAALAPMMFFMGSGANPTAPTSILNKAMGIVVVLAGLSTPLSLILGLYIVFSRKSEFPKWFLWILPVPFLGLFLLAVTRLDIRPFFPFSFR
jgi:hypothetical protein